MCSINVSFQKITKTLKKFFIVVCSQDVWTTDMSICGVLFYGLVSKTDLCCLQKQQILLLRTVSELLKMDSTKNPRPSFETLLILEVYPSPKHLRLLRVASMHAGIIEIKPGKFRESALKNFTEHPCKIESFRAFPKTIDFEKQFLAQ